MSSVGKVVPSVSTQVDRIQRWAAAQGAAGPYHHWYTPNDTVYNYNPAAIAEAFNREEVETLVGEIIDQSGLAGDVMASVAQADILAALERAYQTRHKSACRARAHAQSKLRGQGQDTGFVQSGILGYLNFLLDKTKSDKAV